MPTVCSACGRTSGMCESCKKVDAIIGDHETLGARVVLRRALKSMTPDEPSTDSQQECGDNPAPSPT